MAGWLNGWVARWLDTPQANKASGRPVFSCIADTLFSMGIYRWCRALIQSDPNWQGGDYYDGPGP